VRRYFALAALAALSACGSGGTDPIIGAAVEELSVYWTDEEPANPTAGTPLTRADIQAANTAAIWARLESDSAPTLMYALARNGPYITYMSQFRQSVTMVGTQVTGTRGLGTDLLSAWSTRGDPLTNPTPPSQWPQTIQRNYELPADGPVGLIQTYTCRFEMGGVAEMVILQVRHRGVEVSETCTGPAGSFENLHFADASSGFVWRSLQWIGPQMDLLDVQVLEPYTGG
jgi:hypothetical protein